MAKVKTFLLSFLIAALSIVFIAGCSTDTGTGSGGGNGGGTDNGGEQTGLTPIDLIADPFSLLGVYQVDLYGINGEPVNTPTQASELRVGLNLATAAGGMGAPEVLMLLNFDGKIIPFDDYVIDLGNMGGGDLNDFISTTFANLGAELIEGDQYGLYFTLNPAKNPQYQPLVTKNVIQDGQYLKLKLTKIKDIAPDSGLGDTDVPQDPEKPLEVTDIAFDKTVHNITTTESFQLQTYFAPIGATSNLTWETSDPQVATVENGKVTILKNGNVTITATTENGKTATLEIKEAVLGEISLDKNELTLYVNNDGTEAQTHPLVLSGVPDILGATVNYETNNGETVVSVDQNGLVTAKAAGQANVTVKVSVGGVEKTATCVVKVEAYPEGIAFEKFEYGVALGSTIKIQPYLMGTTEYAIPVTYSTDKGGIIDIDIEGNITPIQTGDVEVTATYSVAGKTYTATCTVGVYTPIDISRPDTLVGTYEFVDFTSDSIVDLWVTKIEVYVGTKDEPNYKNTVQRMIGEMSLNYISGNINMTTKIQMESSILEQGKAGVETFGEQLALTTYEPVTYAGNSTQFGTTGSQQKGVVTQDGDMLLISQNFEKSGADVTVKTYVRKKSDTPKPLNNLRYFDYLDFGKSSPSNAREHSLGDGSPEKEPYYTYGVVNYN